MKAISLWQPWASAIALGIKRIETRSWSTNFRGPIAIHAAKRWGKDQRDFSNLEHTLGRLPARVPLGAFVATAVLADVRPTEELTLDIEAIERMYGDYSFGRFGWILENIVALPEPIPYRGEQGLFYVGHDVFEVAAVGPEAS